MVAIPEIQNPIKNQSSCWRLTNQPFIFRTPALNYQFKWKHKALTMVMGSHRMFGAHQVPSGEGAERDGVSLNQYLITLLAERNMLAEIQRYLNQKALPCEMPEVESEMIITGASSKVLPFHRQQRVVGA